jgi:hypothetical protein
MSYHDIQLFIYGANPMAVYSANFQSGYVAYQLARCKAIQLTSNTVMKGGAGYPNGGSAMIAFWRAIIAMKTSKYGVR